MIQDIIKPFLEGTCTIQIFSDSLHAPIFGCRIHVEDEKLVIIPQVLFDDLEDELRFLNLDIREFNGLDLITLGLKAHPNLRSITIIKEKH